MDLDAFFFIRILRNLTTHRYYLNYGFFQVSIAMVFFSVFHRNRIELSQFKFDDDDAPISVNLIDNKQITDKTDEKL